MIGKIDRKDIMSFISNDDFIENAKRCFGSHQPHIWQTGYYRAPSWNWAYQVGITSKEMEKETKYFEVVTQFGEVVAAREISLDQYN